MQQLFTVDVANMLFNSFVVYGDAHIQLATCSLLVRMCCVQSWWGDFLANIFCTLFSSQNTKIFPQDRLVVFLCFNIFWVTKFFLQNFLLTDISGKT